MAQQTRYIYATAANGMEVRIPAEKYPEWQKAQEEIRAGKRKADPQTAQQLRSLMVKR